MDLVTDFCTGLMVLGFLDRPFGGGIFHFFGARLGRSMSREMSLLGAVFLGFLIFRAVSIRRCSL